MIRQRLLKDQVLTDRERKNISILELIGKSGPMTKTDISKITELNIVTVSNYINNYIKAGLIEEKGLDISSGGRKPTLIDLNYKSGYVLGVSLTKSFSEICTVLVDYGSNMIKMNKRSWDPNDRSEHLIDEMVAMVDELIEESGVDSEKIKGIGVGLPGIIDERGITVKWPSSVGKIDISVCLPVRSIFEKKFRIPVFIERADTCAVAGERWLGLSSDVQNVLFMYSGIGCGIMTCGQLYRGTSGTAGELGISSTEEAVNEDPYNLGRWEMDLGICDGLRKKIAAGEQTSLADKQSFNLADVVAAAKEGDKLAMEEIQHSGHQLGRKTSFLINLLNPEVVVIGGGIEEAGPIFLDAIRKTVKNWSVEEASNVVKIIPSTLSGDRIVAMGAACAVIQEMFAQV